MRTSVSRGAPLLPLPGVGKPGTMVGRLSKAAAEETKLPAGIALCRGGGDQQCAAVGAGVIRQGLAEVTIGTAAMMVAHLENPELVIGAAPYIGGHAVPGRIGRRRRRLLNWQLLKMVARQFRPDRAYPSRAGRYERLRQTHRLNRGGARRESGDHFSTVFRRTDNTVLRRHCARWVPRSGPKS